MELCQRVANLIRDDLKLSTLKIEWKPVTSSNRFEALKKREIDLECATSTKTLGRMEDVSSASPQLHRRRLAADQGRLQSYSNNGDLNGRTIGVLPGTTTENPVETGQPEPAQHQSAGRKPRSHGFSLLRTGARSTPTPPTAPC